MIGIDAFARRRARCPLQLNRDDAVGSPDQTVWRSAYPIPARHERPGAHGLANVVLGEDLPVRQAHFASAKLALPQKDSADGKGQKSANDQTHR